jgi:serine/threonine protein phosphatase PrpC
MEKFGHEEVLHTRKEKRHFGQKIFKLWGEKHEEERPVADSGLATFNKGNFIGQPERQNEDAAYYNPKEGIFGVFDGAGGMSGAAKASEIAVAVMREMVEDNIPESTDDMKEIMESINDTIYYDPASGHSTGVIGRVIEENGKKSLLYSSVGDSRIYLIRDGKAKQITIDEGSGNVIYNSLGRSSAEIKQAGKISLKKGDNIVFCSDGITGDFEKDFIPDDELAEIVEQSSSATKAANALIRRATKIDDRTALVVRV